YVLALRDPLLVDPWAAPVAVSEEPKAHTLPSSDPVALVKAEAEDAFPAIKETERYLYKLQKTILDGKPWLQQYWLLTTSSVSTLIALFGFPLLGVAVLMAVIGMRITLPPYLHRLRLERNFREISEAAEEEYVSPNAKNLAISDLIRDIFRPIDLA